MPCLGSSRATRSPPPAGLELRPEPRLRLNVLTLHDDSRPRALRPTRRRSRRPGIDAAGLYETATLGATPILCARCHLSNALPGTGYAGIPPLTQALHGAHASVIDPTNGLTLDASANRSACYRCHPGSETQCLRGAMGSAVAADGTLAMQCQGCHGTMTAVGSATRTGWLYEPACQQCHTGTATNNNGQIRYTTVFDSTGQPRVAANQTFATNPNVPAAGFSLYRFSKGHGDLACEACHGSTHAEFPSSHGNDNVQSLELQGHVGMIVRVHDVPRADAPTTSRRAARHAPARARPGSIAPRRRRRAAARGRGCEGCHGTDYRGTVLSRALGRPDPERRTSAPRRSGAASRSAATPATTGPSSENGEPEPRPPRSSRRASDVRRDARSASRSRPPTPTGTP